MVACEQEVWKQVKQADRTAWINTLTYLDLFSLLPEQNLLSLFISTQRDCTAQNINLKRTSIMHLFNRAFIEHLLCARHWPGHQWTFRHRFHSTLFITHLHQQYFYSCLNICNRHKNTPLQNQFSVCFYFDINISGLDNIHLKTAIVDLKLLFVVQSTF